MGKARFHYDNTFILNPLRCGSFDVCQVGDLFCGQDYTVPGHRQDCFELSLVVTGKATFSINEEVYTVSKGDLVCNIPGDYHVIRSDDRDPMRMLYLGFSVNREYGNGERFPQLEKRLCELKERIVPGQQELSVTFFKLLNEIHQDEAYNAELTEMYVNEIVILACRSLLGKESRRLPALPDATENGLIYDIINLLDSRSVEVGHLSSIGERLGYSYSYLSQMFSKRIGMSITEYFHLRLFETALQSLYDGAGVTAVAEKLGYTSVPNFSRAFTNYFGVPPRRFREIDAQWLDTGRIRLELAKSRAGRKPQEEDRSDRKQEQQYER